MFSRFFLIVALAKLWEPRMLGEYGIFLALVTISTMFVSASFYNYSMREISSNTKNQWCFIIQHQIVAQLILIVISLIAILLLLFSNFIEIKYLFWFFLILFFEVLNQNIQYLLIAMHKQIASSLVMLFRFGVWVYIVLFLMYTNQEFNTIETVFFAWTLGSIPALILGSFFIYREVPLWRWVRVDRNKLRRGFKVGLVLFVIDLTVAAFFVLDRLYLEELGLLDALGVYIFYITLVMGFLNFLEPSVFSFLYPKMVENYQKGNKDIFLKLFNELKIQTIVIGVILICSLWLLLPYILDWIDKEIYFSYMSTFTMLLITGGIYALSMVPHYGLYAMKQDVWNMIISISTLFLLIITVQFEISTVATLSVATSLLISFVWMLLAKWIVFNSLRKRLFVA